MRPGEKDTNKLHRTEIMRILRGARRKAKNDHVKNVDIWRDANIGPMIAFLRQKRLRWYGHVPRKEGEDTTKNMLNMQVQGKRRRGGGYHQEDVKHAIAGKEKKGRIPPRGC